MDDIQTSLLNRTDDLSVTNSSELHINSTGRATCSNGGFATWDI